jgi:DNA-binding beta-propeller fold protein YncE
VRIVGRSLIVVVSFLASCTGATVNPENRPCNSKYPCGPGTHCDPATGTCVRDMQADGSTKDLSFDQPVQDLKASEVGGDLFGQDAADGPAQDMQIPDILQPDLFQPDQFVVPDAGCPVGFTTCGTACANTSTDLKHCGGCNKPCPAGAADKCVAGKCVCGSSGAVCSAGLNCVNGACACVPGGRCNGCCKGATCIPAGPGQSENECGQNGAACKSCHDGNYCTQDSCTAAGACLSATRPDGTSCSDGVACSHSDACKAGVCAGVTYSCDDALHCTNDSCTGNGPPNSCTNTLNSGHCLIAGACYHDGEGSSTTACTQVCKVAQNTGAWTAYSGACVMTIAGDGAAAYKNGPALSASFNDPFDVLVTSGKIYVADRLNHRVRLVDAGVVSTVAGTGVAGFANGAALTSARFNEPHALVLDGSGGILVADQENQRIRRIASGSVTTAAGTGTQGFLDGAALSARFNHPTGIAMDGSGNVYIADRNNNRIRMITTSGQVSTFAGSGMAGLQDGAASQARFSAPMNLAIDASGNIYVADSGNNRIRKISGGQVSTIAGSGFFPGFQDGPAGTSRLDAPIGVAVNSAGTVVYFSDDNERIRTISSGTVSTLAGSGSTGYRDGAASEARFDSPEGLALDGTSVYVADRDNNRIRLIKP